jgi:hypothetical protein
MANPQLSSQFIRSYNSFGGVDIRAVFGNKVIGTLQGISWSVTREKAPIYTMGDPDPRAFARGKRGIAGSLVFIQFDRHALLHEMESAKFWADKDSLRPDGLDDGTISALDPNSGNSPSATAFQAETNFGSSPRDDQTAVKPWFSDQIPPFDITLAAANEYGAAATMRIYGVEILNEGSGVSIDDIVLEHQMTFVCRTIDPWRTAKQAFVDPNSV